MNLLILTQKVDKNDAILGFFHSWILEFAKNYEKVTVICLYEGEHNLPNNVKVLSLGKEKGVSKITYLYNFYKFIFQERKNYDKVFVHMNQIYIILGGLFWKLSGKEIGLWYAHGSIPFGLRIATKITNYIFTSTESGFRINSKRKRVVGQGIDVSSFKPSDLKINSDTFNIVTVGRISPVKDLETLIKAINLIKNDIPVRLNIIGEIILGKDRNYKKNLEQKIKEMDLGTIVTFVGSVPNNRLVDYLRKNDLFVNTSHTGSLDKTVLEAMATGLPVLNCNEALLDVFGDLKGELMFPKRDFEALSVKMRNMSNNGVEYRNKLGSKLRDIVVKNHSTENLIKKIKDIYKA